MFSTRLNHHANSHKSLDFGRNDASKLADTAQGFSSHLDSKGGEKLFSATSEERQVKSKASDITDDVVVTSEEFITKTKIVGEELKETYNRISKRLQK